LFAGKAILLGAEAKSRRELLGELRSDNPYAPSVLDGDNRKQQSFRMIDAQTVDLIKTIVSPLLGGGLALFGVRLTGLLMQRNAGRRCFAHVAKSFIS